LINIFKKALSISPFVWPFRPNGLYAFNYHRIGDPELTCFDPNLFSCTAERFEQQLKFYKSNFDVISVAELNQLIKAENPITERLAIITFDDGYIDNYSLAFPILKSEKITACFYIATDFVDKGILPWWDEVAFIINQTQPNEIIFPSLSKPLKLNHLSLPNKIKAVLEILKQDSSSSMSIKIEHLKNTLNWNCSAYPNQTLFMNWSQIKEMHQQGMEFGSQTCTHPILAHLSDTDQNEEIIRSKLRLVEKLKKPITSFAYPVGGIDAFNQYSIQSLKASEFTHAFTFMPGINRDLSSPFNLLRFSIHGNCLNKVIKKQINRAILKN
jgi:peptidoglycan/xylan/chitin deacetylase (PgdA/CDA1 family)